MADFSNSASFSEKTDELLFGGKLGLSYQLNQQHLSFVTDGLTLSANIEGKDAFYFSNSHDQKSQAYNLLNTSAEYYLDNWKITLWGRNLTDTKYDTRGFYFGNDPTDGWLQLLIPKKANQKPLV